MTDWGEPLVRANAALKLAEAELLLGNMDAGYRALDDTVAAIYVILGAGG